MTLSTAKRHKSHPPILRGQHKPIACLLEDIPQHYLKGQSYPLATPLLASLSCLLEDTPQTVLKGQFYPLATPLLTPLSCLLEDTPQTVLKGQFYPLATSLASVWETGWFSFYGQRLGQPGFNYWEWSNYPLHQEFSPELGYLLQLEEPPNLVKSVLESLARDYHTFWRWDKLCAFRQWHQKSADVLGLNCLKKIYSRCYGMPWEKVKLIVWDSSLVVDPVLIEPTSSWWKVLGITQFSPPNKVEQAYKNLLRSWHPDRTEHPLAHQITTRVNIAYEEYRLRRQRNTERLESMGKWFSSLG
ncbi:J domain-containing protein [Crocosphaera sp. Alani8]|uniref:J domain-containing protein n=1 Tax=Crocosphaera sp. Alani8 TaxID=3038952 RepID=UPI00313E21EA